MAGRTERLLDLEPLAGMSRRLGAEVGYIQGGGGNTSLKNGDGLMAIKASGLGLAQVKADDGFVVLDCDLLCRELRRCSDEDEYGSLLRRSVRDPSGARRPSIETGFHALLGRCVLHSHSVWLNLLTCSREGRELAADLLPEALWVPYATPGIALTREMARTIDGVAPAIILLENHGVVVSASDPAEAERLHEVINVRVRKAFGHALPFPWPVASPDMDELLFPDQAIFSCDPQLAASTAGVETRQAVQFLLSAMATLKLTPQFLPIDERSTLLDLESEKYRQRMVRA